MCYHAWSTLHSANLRAFLKNRVQVIWKEKFTYKNFIIKAVRNTLYAASWFEIS